MDVPAPAAISSGPEVLGILLTTKCNIVCRHCCNESHPSNAGAAQFDDIAHLIEMARDVPSIKEIGISGGEPFLFVPLLRRIIEFAASLGFTSSVTTNGFWGKSPDRASELLGELKSSGLRAVNISTSVFHQEFIDIGTVIKAADHALLAGLAVCINLVSTSSWSLEDLRAALGGLLEKVEVVVMPCVSAGRGARHVLEEEFTAGFATPHGNCREHFKKLAVDALGDIYPCCSPGGFTAPLRLGNVKEAPLSSILERSADNMLLAILESVGPQFFLPFLRSARPEPLLPATFTDQCHLCNMMLSSESCLKIIRKASEQLFSELVELAPVDRPVSSGRMLEVIDRRTLQACEV